MTCDCRKRCVESKNLFSFVKMLCLLCCCQPKLLNQNYKIINLIGRDEAYTYLIFHIWIWDKANMQCKIIISYCTPYNWTTKYAYNIVLTFIRHRPNVIDVEWTLKKRCVQGTAIILRSGTLFCTPSTLLYFYSYSHAFNGLYRVFIEGL